MKTIFNHKERKERKARLWTVFLLSLCFLLFTFSAQAQTKITASITVTNKTTNGMTFTVNGNTRTWTNNVVTPATQVLTNADLTGSGSKTNLLNAIYANPFPQVQAQDTGSNTFNLVGNANLAMSVTASAGWAAIAYSTNTVTPMFMLQGPVSSLPTAGARTNVASAIVGAANATENTNTISQTSTAASELMGLNNSQVVAGIKHFTNVLSSFRGTISNSPAISGTVIALAAGLYTSPILAAPTSTNLVNYGDAISSPGPSPDSQQFGLAATAGGISSLAIGTAANAAGSGAVAIGPNAYAPTNSGGGANMAIGGDAQATANLSTAVGHGAIAGGDSSLAIGEEAEADAANSQAIGTHALATHVNSTAIGVGATTTTSNQVVIGSPGSSAVVPNSLSVLTNLTVGGTLTVSGGVTLSGVQINPTFQGTNNYLANSDIAFARRAISSLANGNNAVVPGTNVYCALSGPSGAFTVNSLSGGRDGKLLILENSTGQQLTIANESGFDATAANRIKTGLSGDYVNTNIPGMVTLIYSASASRWLLLSHN